MANVLHVNFPGGSKGRVNRAGEAVRAGTDTPEDQVTIEEWRAGHRHVLNSFQGILRNRTRNTTVLVAQRHKRKRTIFDKLGRFPDMALSRMDDVAGCRLIFNTIEELTAFRASLHKARFDHRLKNHPKKYDYIASPKNTGYRGIHDVYEYDVRSTAGAPYKGLLIELQYRTRNQHAWATAVEVVGHVTENQPKFERGDDRFIQIFRYCSEIIARAFEGHDSCLPELNDAEVVRRFVELDAELHFMAMLRGLNAANREISDQRNVILMFPTEDDSDLEIITYRDAPEALRALFDLERERPGSDIVLVRGDTSEDVREAFRNYFSDARDFINLIDEGCQRLMRARDYADEFLTDEEFEGLKVPVAVYAEDN